jgi:hypothetical protein
MKMPSFVLRVEQTHQVISKVRWRVLNAEAQTHQYNLSKQAVKREKEAEELCGK